MDFKLAVPRLINDNRIEKLPRKFGDAAGADQTTV